MYHNSIWWIGAGYPLYILFIFVYSLCIYSCVFVVVQSLSCVWLFATPWTAACQAPLSFTIFQSLVKLMSIESVKLCNHLIPLLWPSPFPCSLSQHQGLFQWVSSFHQVVKVLELQLQHQFFQWIFRADFLYWLIVLTSLLSKGLSRVFSNATS